MSKSIPLRSTLGIHMIYIIVPDAATQRLDFMLKDLSTESWGLGHIGRETVYPLTYIPINFSRSPAGKEKDILQSNHLTSLDLRSCSLHSRRGEEVQPANLEHMPVRSYNNPAMTKARRKSRKYLVILPPYPGRLVRSPRDLGQLLTRGKPGGIGVPGKLIRALSCSAPGEGIKDIAEAFSWAHSGLCGLSCRSWWS